MNQESSRPGRFLLVIFIWHKDSFYAKQAITIFANFPKIAFVECFGMSRTLEQVAFCHRKLSSNLVIAVIRSKPIEARKLVHFISALIINPNLKAAIVVV